MLFLLLLLARYCAYFCGSGRSNGAMTKSPRDRRPQRKAIRATERTRKPVEAPITTDESAYWQELTDGIYRQPSSALRELISNACDADANEVTILTGCALGSP